MTHRHVAEAAALPRHHDDPFDRMLVAQARLEGLVLVTRDRQLAAYDVSTLPA
ncbi:MAG: type II toxin-antitoxin system VapC family toxin [Actinomycetota bacterium]|nr:type II toxin-antitoxin system VapC family toxin [Actinomycetota bacterium]